MGSFVARLVLALLLLTSMDTISQERKAEAKMQKASLNTLTKSLHQQMAGTEAPTSSNHSSAGNKKLLHEAYRLLEEQDTLKQRYRRVHQDIQAHIDKFLAIAQK